MCLIAKTKNNEEGRKEGRNQRTNNALTLFLFTHCLFSFLIFCSHSDRPLQQAQLYYAGKSRYIGVFDTREKAALAYEIAREKLKADGKVTGDQSLKATENAVNAARKAAFEGVNEKDPRLAAK